MQYGQDDEREINLLEIVWEFFIQWKPALVFSLILAVLVSGVMYVKNEISYRSQLAAYEKGRDFADKDIEKEKRLLEAELTDAEIRKVENEIYNKQLLKYNEEKLEKISGYDLANNRMDYAVIRYSISTDNIPVTGLLTTYRDVAYDDSLMEKLIAENGVYADLLNMTDIVTISYSDRPDAENNNYNTFAVNIALPDGIDEKRVEKIVMDYIEGSQKELQNVIPHKLELVSTGVTTSLSTALTDQVLALRDKIQSLKNTISTDVSAFSDEQEELYYYMLFENDLLEEEDEPVKTEGFSKKFPVIGFAAGIFIYAMLLVCFYLLKGKVRALDEVTDCYRIRGIDEVHERRFDTAWRRFVYSRKIYDLHYRRTAKPLEEHIKDAKGYISDIASHNGLKHVTVIPACEDTAEDGLCRKYAKGLKDAWLNDSVPMEVADNWTTGFSYKAPGDKEGIVILMHAGDTSYTTLERIGGYCNDYDASLIGVVLLEG